MTLICHFRQGPLGAPLPQSCRKAAIQSHTQRAKLAELSRHKKTVKKGRNEKCRKSVQ